MTVPNTFIATTEAISQAGARIEFVDVDQRTYTMDPGAAARVSRDRLHPRQRADDPLTSEPGARSPPSCPFTCTGRWPTWIRSSSWPTMYGLIVVEDACQAHGAEYLSKRQQRW